MDDQQLLRYSRHILLEELGIEGQEKLLASHALVIGAGGLGSPVTLYLGSAGVGRITVVDDDTVSLSNLQRQVIHAQDRLGMDKVTSASIALAGINPFVTVTPVRARLDAETAERLERQARGTGVRVAGVIENMSEFICDHGESYALFGTDELSRHAVEALDGRKACLLANHGMITLGRDLDEAMAIAVEVESLCQQYLLARQAGRPTLLSSEEMQQVIEKFQNYGRNAQNPAKP